MKTPTAEPQPAKSRHAYDISTWIAVVVGILALVKLGIVVSRHI